MTVRDVAEYYRTSSRAERSYALGTLSLIVVLIILITASMLAHT